ncbi:hypothetical protein GCM10010106_29040 [Thermopolyspora flexuosa]|jgi:CRISPR system Cascade subunit CasB|uniref:CRISPR system Cascade subunit CasB n=1 Tax=Thermopolyspora flexuosa TaxID=103836 RepID=A0A543IS26_9ACTN|nr:type I-E CRISPR-associated protein Cse2/CasB [Thermopolyspora flexuosa]TQM73374.1 CRISPR system Cascade subunit CasB [Thermopolyspora flexuosa]GGM80558.1 hypothetical protein GCM10010106_29040 [Thermopolyspora flexuosa]
MVNLKVADAYVAHVRRQVREPGRRAALRRSLGRPVEDVVTRLAHAVVAPWLPADRTWHAVERAYYSVAALIAAQPRDRQSANTTAEPDEEESVSEPSSDERAGDDSAKAATKAIQRPTVSLGGTLGQAVRDKKLNADSIEARLHLLCRQDVAGLHRMLPGLFHQMAAKEVTPDWGRLLVDLARWERDRDHVTKRWLQDYYRAIHRDDEHEQTDDNDSESEDR